MRSRDAFLKPVTLLRSLSTLRGFRASKSALFSSPAPPHSHRVSISMPPSSKFHPLWPRITQIFFLTAALESLTVYVCVNWFDGVNLNKHTASNSTESFLLKPIISTIIAWAFCVTADKAIRARIPQMDQSLDFKAFSKEVFKSWHVIPWFVLIFTYALGVNRLFPIASNIIYIITGISPGELITHLISSSLRISSANAQVVLFCIIGFLTLNYFQRRLYKNAGGV